MATRYLFVMQLIASPTALTSIIVCWVYFFFVIVHKHLCFANLKLSRTNSLINFITNISELAISADFATIFQSTNSDTSLVVPLYRTILVRICRIYLSIVVIILMERTFKCHASGLCNKLFLIFM